MVPIRVTYNGKGGAGRHGGAERFLNRAWPWRSAWERTIFELFSRLSGVR